MLHRQYGVDRAERVEGAEAAPGTALVRVPAADERLVSTIVRQFGAETVFQELPPRRHPAKVRLGGDDAPYNRVTFHAPPSFDETAVRDARVKLCKFDHVPGATVHADLFPCFELPNGEKCFFYLKSEVACEAFDPGPPPPPAAPDTLDAIRRRVRGSRRRRRPRATTRTRPCTCRRSTTARRSAGTRSRSAR